jgi:hypothetical protein
MPSTTKRNKDVTANTIVVVVIVIVIVIVKGYVKASPERS